jgi:hypothetical protein
MGLGGAPPAGACSPSDPVPSSAELAPATVSAINALRDSYDRAAQDNGLSWTVLAAIDYREDGNDPGRSALSGEPIGSANPDSGTVTTSKLDSLERAAETVKAMASSVNGVALTASSGGDDVKNAFLAYNRGSIYKSSGAPADSSPYVMNQYDDAHRDMRWPDVAGEPLAGQTEYGRYGAFTVFTRLGGSAPSGCAGLSGNRIVAIAQQQLGLKEVPDGCNCGPEIQPFLGSSSGEAWCADFVSWVYKEAGSPFSGGSDGGWRLAGVSGLHQWLVDNGIWHNRGDGDVPQPGDVVIFADDEHTGIVEKTDGTTLDTIEGNTSNQVARRSYDDYAANGEIVGWGRQRGERGGMQPAALGEASPARWAA